MAPSARTVEEYLAALAPERRAALRELRRLIRRHLPSGFEEGLQYGTIAYSVPLARYPNTYNGQPLAIVSLASQKQYMALYLMAVYGDAAKERRLSAAFRAAGKKLDMGKACLRFRSLDDLPLDAIAEVLAGTSVDAFIARYEASRSASKVRQPRPAPKKKSKAASKKKARKKRARRAD